jgi:hypothetical protein
MLLPVHALALIEWRIYETGTYPARRVQDASPADELREVTGLSYCVGDNDFLVASDQANYCGLLSPDTSLEAFLDAHTCLHAPRQPVCHAAVLAAAGRNN